MLGALEEPVAPITIPLDGWSSAAAPGSEARIEESAAGLTLHFSLAGHGAWAIARRVIAFEMPAHYAAVLRLAGTAPPVELQVKLIDPGGANVWWWRRRNHPFATQAERLVLRRASLDFAWGPQSGGTPGQVGAVEVAVASNVESAGSLRIESLAIEPRAAAPARPRALATDRSDDAITLDFGRSIEFGGVVVRWHRDARACRLLGSDDGTTWQPLAAAEASSAARTWLRTAEGDARFARIEIAGRGAAQIESLAAVPLEAAVAPARHAAAVAVAAPRGAYPRHLLGEAGAWALVGVDADDSKGLLGEDGALEIAIEQASVEPFVVIGDRVFGWADVDAEPSLADTIPTVTWRAPGWTLAISGFGIGNVGASTLAARYALANGTDETLRARLVLALRPYQVTPAWQGLNLRAGVAPLTLLERDGARLRWNGSRELIAVTAPDAAALVPSEAAPIAARLVPGTDAPRETSLDDPLGFAEAAFGFDLEVAPGASEVVAVATPLHAGAAAIPSGLGRSDATRWVDAQREAVASAWRARLDSLPIELPPAAAHFADSVRASLAWILLNREGPRIQPGARCYRRSWIRDGALTATAIAEWGFADEARAFVRWYAPYQFPDGRVPCAVDAKGVDLVAEHDSHGQLVWAIVELFRLTGDGRFLIDLWPHVERAATAIEALRAQRTTEAFRGDGRFGMLPESISHEGYASNPVHSYWDDAFALRGLADAAWAAGVVGDARAQVRFAASSAAMRDDFAASVRRAIEEHHIDFVPGSVELGDLDPTSTAIAFDPCGVASLLPAAALAHTFERYWQEFEQRRHGERPAKSYTPYEVRNATALLALGWKDRALALLETLLSDQRPNAWCQWPEVTWRDRRLPRFVGDLPHGWVASSYLRSVRRLIVSEGEGETLVLGAGIPESWVRDPAGVRGRGLATRFGRLDLAIEAPEPGRVRVAFGGALRAPPNGIEIASPLAAPLRGVRVDGTPHRDFDARRARLRDLPRVVELHY